MVAREPLLDGIELEQQIVAERPYQAEAPVLLVAELLDERAQNRKDARLLTALLFRKQSRQRLQLPGQHAAVLQAERIPVWMIAQHRGQHLVQHFAARVQRSELHAPVERQDLERRPSGGEVPA